MILRTLYRIGRRPAYSGLFFGTFALALIVLALFPNAALVERVLFAEVAPMTKLVTLFVLLGSLPAAFSAMTLLIAISFAALMALNVTVLTFYVRRRRSSQSARTAKIGVTSLGGLVSGVLGIGCAACGSIVLSAVVTTFGGVGILALLPLGGSEFALVGLGLLLFSSYSLIKHVNDPLLCAIED